MVEFFFILFSIGDKNFFFFIPDKNSNMKKSFYGCNSYKQQVIELAVIFKNLNLILRRVERGKRFLRLISVSYQVSEIEAHS